MTQRRESGFSLIELLIVLSIVMIMAAFVAPNIQITLNRYRLETKGRRLASMFLIAKRTAAKTNRRVPILYDPAAKILWVDADREGDRDPGEQITLMRVNDTVNPFAFPPLGEDYDNIPFPLPTIMQFIQNKSVLNFHPNGTLIEATPGCFTNCPWQVATTIRAMTIKQNNGNWIGTVAVTITPSGTARLWIREEFSGTLIRDWSPL